MLDDDTVNGFSLLPRHLIMVSPQPPGVADCNRRVC